MVLTVVLEAHTRSFASKRRVAENLTVLLSQLDALRNLGSQTELVIVSNEPISDCPPGAANLVDPSLAYYGLKDLGLKHARGEIVMFADSDCRLGPDYLKIVCERFRGEPALALISGVTYYHGKKLLSRINTALSFGHLFAAQPSEALKGAVHPLLSHNVAVRRRLAPQPVFGPFSGRVGGERFLGEFFAKPKGCANLDRRLEIYHEDPSYSVPLLIEKHLRDQLCWLRSPDILSIRHPRTVLSILRSIWNSKKWRRKKLEGAASSLRLGPVGIGLGRLVIEVYTWMDLSVVFALILFPFARRKWFSYQEGTKFA